MRNHKIRNFLKSFLSLGFSAVTQKSHAEKLLRIKEVTYICSQTVDSHRSTIWWKKIHPQSYYSLILVSWGRQIIIVRFINLPYKNGQTIKQIAPLKMCVVPQVVGDRSLSYSYSINVCAMYYV